jgi:hypothetical protein
MAELLLVDDVLLDVSAICGLPRLAAIVGTPYFLPKSYSVEEVSRGERSSGTYRASAESARVMP